MADAVFVKAAISAADLQGKFCSYSGIGKENRRDGAVVKENSELRKLMLH